jgi:hypothetical protein
VTTAFQSDAFQADQLAFQIDGGVPAVQVVVPSSGADRKRLRRKLRRIPNEIREYVEVPETVVIQPVPPTLLDYSTEKDDDEIILIAISRWLH